MSLSHRCLTRFKYERQLKGRGALTFLTTSVILASVGLMLAGCGTGASQTAAPSGSTSPTASPEGSVPSLVAMLPPEIRNAGEITVATDADYPPFEFLGTDGKTMTGLSADLMQAALTVLGLKPNIKIVSFESLIPGFAAGRWQVSLAAVNVTPERSQVVDFVTYMQDGSAFYQSAKNSLHLPASYSAVEGHTVAVQSGSSQATAANAAAIGKHATVLEYSLQSAVNLAVQSGRADFAIGSSLTVGYLMKTVPGFKLAAPPFDFATVVGFAVAKDSGMGEPLRAALAYLEKNGTYQPIFKKWGEQAGMRPPKVVTGQ